MPAFLTDIGTVGFREKSKMGDCRPQYAATVSETSNWLFRHESLQATETSHIPIRQ
jgi:hypothetical protein